MPTPAEEIEVDGHTVKITNPEKLFFPDLGITKMQLVEYYLAVMPGLMTAAGVRPTTMYRWPNGVEAPEDAFFQKRVPERRPEWLETARVHFPSGRMADLLVLADGAHVAWALNLGCIDFNPWPVRVPELDHPDELRVDLDPTPGIPFEHARDVAMVAQEVLSEHGLTGYPKTSGKRGIHIFVPIRPQWTFTEVRRAALAFAREVERRDARATTAWWKEERVGVFLDYNQNARDRTIASAYSVRPVADARVSCPLEWDEVPDVEPETLNALTVPERFETKGDPQANRDAHEGSLESLHELAARDEAGGLGEAPWPPHFPKAQGEPVRVAPSRAKSVAKKSAEPKGPARKPTQRRGGRES